MKFLRFFKTKFTAIVLLFTSFTYLLTFLLINPGNLTWDWVQSFSEAAGNYDQITAQTPLFSYLLKLILPFKYAMSIFTFLNAIGLILVISFAVILLRKSGVKLWICYSVLVFYNLFPAYHAAQTFSLKDIWYSIFYFSLIILIYTVISKPDFITNKKWIISYTLVSILVSGLRTEGIVICVVLYAALLICFRKYYKKILLQAGIFAISFGLLTALFAVLPHAQKANSAEGMSVPIQMVGRVLAEDSGAEAQSEIEYFINLQPLEVWQKYDSVRSDVLKENLRISDNFQMLEFLDHTKNLCASNLAVCAKAYWLAFEQYINPFAAPKNDRILTIRGNSGEGIFQYLSSPPGISPKSKAELEQIALKPNSEFEYSISPKIGSFLQNNILNKIGYNNGIWLWLLIGSLILVEIIRKPRFLLLLIPTAISFAVLFSTAPIAFFRYLFPQSLILPFVLAVLIDQFLKQRKQKNAQFFNTGVLSSFLAAYETGFSAITDSVEKYEKLFRKLNRAESNQLSARIQLIFHLVKLNELELLYNMIGENRFQAWDVASKAIWVKQTQGEQIEGVAFGLDPAKTYQPLSRLQDLPLFNFSDDEIAPCLNLGYIRYISENTLQIAGYAWIRYIDPKLFEYGFRAFYRINGNGKKIEAKITKGFNPAILKLSREKKIDYSDNGIFIEFEDSNIKAGDELHFEIVIGMKIAELPGNQPLLVRFVNEKIKVPERFQIWDRNSNFAELSKIETEFNKEISETGIYNFNRLLDEYRSFDYGSVDPYSVVFRTDDGNVAIDSAAEIHKTILQRPDASKFKLYWIVRNSKIEVPENGIKVIFESAEYFRVLATAGTYFESNHQSQYFIKRPGQRIIHTGHGYPFKSMGLKSRIERKQAQFWIESFLKRETDWDYIISPAPWCDQLFYDNFDFHGKLLQYGYPRNDILRNKSASEQIRNSVRKHYGIAEDKTVLLYAPTFRENNSSQHGVSEIVSFLNYEKLVAELGNKYILLVRGHSFNRAAGVKVTDNPNIIDVSLHIDPTELILAADIGIFDYSSMRFDFAQTQKPMLFFVPDLKEYFSIRTSLIDFEPTAPGPLIYTQNELQKNILGITQIQAEYSTKYQNFLRDITPGEDGKSAERIVSELFPNL